MTQPSDRPDFSELLDFVSRGIRAQEAADAAVAAAEVPADHEPRPMTGAEALDAATTPEEWANTAAGIFGAIARAAQDEREDGA